MCFLQLNLFNLEFIKLLRLCINQFSIILKILKELEDCLIIVRSGAKSGDINITTLFRNGDIFTEISVIFKYIYNGNLYHGDAFQI